MQGQGKTPKLGPPPAAVTRRPGERAPSSAEPRGGTLRLGAPAAVSVRPPPNVKPGAMIGDKYRIEREIGRGGFGVVVRAIHLTLDQRVAIKVLTESDGATDNEWAEDAARFRLEAKATASLRSDHVVRVLDVDVLDSGYPYIVMEYLDGKTLHELVYSSKAPIAVEDAVDYTLQVLAALADAHSAGIVHRDLKPANVFLSRGIGGATLAKVLDFGVSKMVEAASQRLTRTGAVVGTVAYMAPEQLLDAKGVDGRADLWSAGLLLYEALTKRHPFGVDSGPKVVSAILNESFVPLIQARPDVPPALDAVVSRLLEKSPERRFATTAEVAAALTPLAPLRSRPVLDEIRRAPPPSGAAARPVLASPAGTSGALAAKKSPRAGSFVLAFVIVVLALLAAAALVYRFHPGLLRTVTATVRAAM